MIEFLTAFAPVSTTRTAQITPDRVIITGRGVTAALWAKTGLNPGFYTVAQDITLSPSNTTPRSLPPVPETAWQCAILDPQNYHTEIRNFTGYIMPPIVYQALINCPSGDRSLLYTPGKLPAILSMGDVIVTFHAPAPALTRRKLITGIPEDGFKKLTAQAEELGVSLNELILRRILS